MRNRLINLIQGSLLGSLCLVLAMLVLPLYATAATLTGTEQQVTAAAADQFDPAISGNLVVYTDFSGVDADVWYTDLSNGMAHPVSTAAGDQQLTGASDNKVVYTDWNSMDVLVFDVTTGQTLNITNAAGSNSLDPAISGNLVVWTDDRHGDAEIYAMDLSTGVERRITNNPLVDQSPSVYGQIIVWERADGYAGDIFAYDWVTEETAQVAVEPYASERFPDVYGNIVVYQREQGTPVDKDIVAYDIITGDKQVLSLAGDQENAHISGDYVSFNDSASGTPHIALWQLSTGEYFGVTEGSGQYLNDIDGDSIVYSDNRAGTLDIWMFNFSIEDIPEDENYEFGGFQQPINADGSSIFKLGSTIPVKITLTDDAGQNVSTATVTLSVAQVSNTVTGSEVEMLADSPGQANTDNLFRYEPLSRLYIYNLSTKGYTKGSYRVSAKIGEQSYSINFSLRK